jgi:hypothetical protein
MGSACAVLSIPTAQKIYIYPAAPGPTSSSEAAQAKPIGMGDIATGGPTLQLAVSLDRFSAPVDLYLGVQLTTLVPGEIFLFDSANSLAPLSSGGLVKWKTSLATNLNVSPLPPIPVSALPGDTYNFYLLAAPSGSVSTFYLWVTSVSIPLRNQDAIDCLVTVSQAQESFFWDLLKVFSNNYTLELFSPQLQTTPNDFLQLTEKAGRVLNLQPRFQLAANFLEAKAQKGTSGENLQRQISSVGSELEAGLRLANAWFDKMANVHSKGRKNIVQMWEGSDAQQRQRMWEIARENYGGRVANSPDEFIEQVRSDQLRNEANFLYNQFVSEEDAFNDWAERNGEKPGRIVAREGGQLVTEGVKLTYDSARRINPAIDQAADAVEKFNQLTDDPEGFLGDQAEAHYTQITQEFLQNSAGLSESVSQELAQRGIKHIRYRVKQVLVNQQEGQQAETDEVKRTGLGYVTPQPTQDQNSRGIQAYVLQNDAISGGPSDAEILAALVVVLMEGEPNEGRVVPLETGSYTPVAVFEQGEEAGASVRVQAGQGTSFPAQTVAACGQITNWGPSDANSFSYEAGVAAFDNIPFPIPNFGGALTTYIYLSVAAGEVRIYSHMSGSDAAGTLNNWLTTAPNWDAAMIHSQDGLYLIYKVRDDGLTPTMWLLANYRNNVVYIWAPYLGPGLHPVEPYRQWCLDTFAQAKALIDSKCGN